MATQFKEIYDIFFDKITDDMYIELTEYDTKKDCQSILISAIPLFEFPKKSLAYDSRYLTYRTQHNFRVRISSLYIRHSQHAHAL